MNRRHSIQKQMILEALRKLDHPTAQEVLEEVRKQYPHISMGTVYRNLNILSDTGVLKKLSSYDSPERFDIQLHPHYHMKCTRCGRIINIDEDYMEEVDRKIEQSTGFSIESHSIFFKGICPSCKDG